MIAGVYARKSTEDERTVEDGKSIERQREHATAYAEAQGWIVDPELVFIDENVSGAEFVNRPGLARLRAVAATHRFERLVVMDQSRLGRDTIRTLNVILDLHDHGVEIHSYLDRAAIKLDTDTAEVTTFMRSWSDTKARTDASKRTRDGLSKKAKAGHATGGRPYGYDVVRVGDHSEYRVNPDQAAIVQQLFAWALEGLGAFRLRTRLTELTGQTWPKNRIQRLLRNPVYVGRLAWGRTRVVSRGGKAKRREKGEPAVVVERPELRIITDEVWNQVQTLRAATAAHHGKGGAALKPAAGTTRKYLLTGILRCGTCGSTMSMIGNHGLRYFCLGRARNGATFCSTKGSVPMEALDKGVLKVLLDELIGDPERLWRIIKERETLRAVPAAPVVNVTKEVAKLEKEIGNLVQRAADGDPDILAGIRERRSQVERLKAKEKAAPVPVTKEAVLKGYTALRVRINRKNPAEVRALLARLGCDRIVVTKTGPKSWEFEGSFDAGRALNIAPPYPAEPSLIETDANGYLLNTCPPTQNVGQ
jgi:DNA invertase Pin-like site-specific DNA recombinase